MDVRKSAADPEAAALSGGNLQKFIIGRELDRQPSVMVVNQPTWGVDAGAAARIRQALIELARSGSAVLVISQDLDELFEISDAIAVMHNGELSKPLPIAEATFEKIGLLMGGAEPGHVEHVQEVGLMRIELVKRPQRSTLFSVLSPFIALGLTLIAGAIMFSHPRQESARGALLLFHRPAARDVVAARARHQGGAADPDRGRPVGLLPLQQLEHRRRRPVHHRRASPARCCRCSSRVPGRRWCCR